MTPSRSAEWGRVQELEDVMALLSEADDRRLVIRRQAWREGDWRVVFAEATRQGQALARIKELLSAHWTEWHAIAKGEHDEY